MLMTASGGREMLVTDIGVKGPFPLARGAPGSTGCYARRTELATTPQGAPPPRRSARP
jgi:hypothetical protein